MSSDSRAHPAALVDPATIAARAHLADGAELLVRDRPPGRVSLEHGQREHMLMSSTGCPVDAGPVRSVLRTEDERREWESCPKGHVTFVPAGFPIEWDWNYKSHSLHLTLLPSFLDDIASEFRRDDGRSPPLRPLFRVLDEELGYLIRNLHRETTAAGLGRDLVTSSLLLLIAARLYRLSAAPTADRRTQGDPGGLTEADRRRCIDLLNERLGDKISLAELAAEFGMSPYHFARLFKRATGFPPHEFQLQLRIARARELLGSQPSTTLADIACELGFSDESHFRRHFRRIVGVTPGRYRR